MDHPKTTLLPIKELHRDNSGDRFVLEMFSPDVDVEAVIPHEDDIVAPMRNLNLGRLIKSDRNTTEGTGTATIPCTTNSGTTCNILEDLNSEPYDWKGFLTDPNGAFVGNHRQVKRPMRKPSEAARLFLQHDGIPQNGSRRRNKKSEAAALFLNNNDEGANDYHFVSMGVEGSSQNVSTSTDIMPYAIQFDRKNEFHNGFGLPPQQATNCNAMPSKQNEMYGDKRRHLLQNPRFIPNIKRPEARTPERKRCKCATIKPTDLDVLLGRGGGTNYHAGNIRFRKIVADEKNRYTGLGNSKKEKTYFSEHIVKTVHSYGGRFLQQKKIKGTVTWFIVDFDVARKKCSQALRER